MAFRKSSPPRRHSSLIRRVPRLVNYFIAKTHVRVHPLQQQSIQLRSLQLEKDGDSLSVWSGELFLELHNATYTTQADIKKMNRMCEFLLREQEFVQAVRFAQTGQYRSMEAEWKSVLLNQFHDVLPGTSIADVYFDAKNLYRQVYASLLTAPDTLRSFNNQRRCSHQFF